MSEFHHRSNVDRLLDQERRRPPGWGEFRRSHRRRWLIPVLAVDWVAGWAAYGLSRLSILALLEYCGSFSILIAVIFYFLDAPQRVKMRHYQAWQVINTAQGKGGAGGRIEALAELNDDHVSLMGVNVSGAMLEGVRLANSDIHFGDLSAADLIGAHLNGANLWGCSFLNANLRGARLEGAILVDASLKKADLTGASLAAARVAHVDFTDADLSGADLSDAVDWRLVASYRGANIHGVLHAPDGFLALAVSEGAVDRVPDAP